MIDRVMTALLAAQQRRAAALAAATQGVATLQQTMAEMVRSLTAPRKVQRDGTGQITGYTIGE